MNSDYFAAYKKTLKLEPKHESVGQHVLCLSLRTLQHGSLAAYLGETWNMYFDWWLTDQEDISLTTVVPRSIITDRSK